MKVQEKLITNIMYCKYMHELKEQMSLSSLCTLLSLALIILAPSNNLLPVVNFSQAVTTSPSPPVPGTIIHHNSRAHVDTGSLYNFKLNPQRTGLLFDADGPLADKVANTPDEIEQGGIIFGKGFGVITDIQVNPYDGNLYVLTFAGSIYRISSSSDD